MMVSSARAQAMIGTRAGRSSSLLDAASASNTVTQQRFRRAFGDTRQLAFDLSAPPQARGAGQRQSLTSGMSSPWRVIYCLCSISLSRRACLAFSRPRMSRGRERSVGPGLEHREFDARRAGIDHEDRFVHALDLAWLGGQSAFIRARRGTDRCPRESRPGSRAPARPGESRPASDRVPSADKSRRPRRARSGTSLAASR